MKRVVVIFLLFSLSVVANAQNVTFKSKILLKDGSELHVVIIENVPGEYIKILLPGDTEATIDYANIVSIKHKNYSYNPDFSLPKGINFQGSTSLMFGRQNEYNFRGGLVLGVTANYRFNPLINLGIGIDPTIATGYILLPIYVHLSGSLKEERVAPVYYLDGGWSFAGSNNNSFGDITTEGGWFARPGFGLRFNRISTLIGYQIQSITTTTVFPDWSGGDEQRTVEERVMKNIIFSFTYNF